MPKRLVIDSSVALKWWLDDEEFVEEARVLLNELVGGKIELVVPELWLYEIANGINTAVKRGRISNDTGEEFIEELQSITATLVPVNSYLTKTYKESAKYNHAIYDIVYMVVAENKQIPFITADKKFCDKVKSKKPFVTHLSDCKDSLPQRDL